MKTDNFLKRTTLLHFKYLEEIKKKYPYSNDKNNYTPDERTKHLIGGSGG